MKSRIIIFIFTFLLATISTPAHQAKAVPVLTIAEVIKQAVIKAIKALDLKIQRLQNETIWLQNAQKVLENKLSELKLKEISEWTEKQRRLYDDYFQELWKVKNAISSFHRVKEIMKLQVKLTEEYQRAYELFRQYIKFI